PAGRRPRRLCVGTWGMAQDKDKPWQQGEKAGCPSPPPSLVKDHHASRDSSGRRPCRRLNRKAGCADRRQVLRSGGFAPATRHAKQLRGESQRVGEKVQPVRRKSFSPVAWDAGSDLTQSTPSRTTVWYPRNGEGQSGAAHFVLNRVRNAR